MIILQSVIFSNNKATLIEDYKSGKITYTEAEFAKGTCYRDIPSVDNSIFTIAKKLILEAKN